MLLQGDVIQWREWEEGPLYEAIVTRTHGSTVHTLDEQLDESQVVKVVKHLNKDEYYTARQEHLLKGIPAEFHGALSHMAWQSGHSAGYDEVISNLSELVDGLAKPIEEFKARIIREHQAK